MLAVRFARDCAWRAGGLRAARALCAAVRPPQGRCVVIEQGCSSAAVRRRATSKGRPPSRKEARAAAPAAAPTLLIFNWGRELDADVFASPRRVLLQGRFEKVSRLEAQFHLHAQRQGDRYVLVFSELRDEARRQAHHR